jgi:replication factor C subunit 2/4
MTKLLVEKYRPRDLENMVGNNDIKNMASTFIKDKHIPHLIISGPSSTGKTSLVHILTTNLFNPSILKDRVLELNASEDRGIRVIRNKIKKYVLSSIDQSNDSAKFKIIILDEADTLSMDSQYALRRIIEDSSKSTRFVLICNNTNKIIPPILSRCMILNFKNLSLKEISERLDYICECEKIDKKLIDKCIENCENSIRTAISLLEKFSKNNSEIEINTEINWNFMNDSTPVKIIQEIQELLLDGNEPTHLMNSFVKYVINEKKLNLEKHQVFLEKVADTCVRLSYGCTPLIQISNVLFYFIQLS